MNDDLHDLFRGMASEGPSDDGLLEGVHAASARADVRRRVLVSSAAALALVLTGIGVVSATRSDGPRVRDQVFGASGNPTPGVSAAPTPVPSAQPSADGTAPPERPSVYQGRAVSADGKPVEGLYVYALPQGFPEVEAFHHWLGDNRPTTRTRADGTFAVPCPSGPVLLTSWPFHLAQDASTPNWAAVFVGGATAPGNSTVPACRETVEVTQVVQGAVVQGTVAGPGLPCPSPRELVSAYGTGSNSIYSVILSNAWTHPAQDGAFRIVGLPLGSYWISAFTGDDIPEHEADGKGYARGQVEVTGAGVYTVELTPTSQDQASCPAPSPTESPGPGEPTPTPTPLT